MAKGTVEASLGIIGVSWLAHTGALPNAKSFVQAKVAGVQPGYTGNLTVKRFGIWAGAFTGLAFILVAGSDSDEYGSVFNVLGGLIAFTSVVLYYRDLAGLFGAVSTGGPAANAKPSNPSNGPSSPSRVLFT